MFYALKPGQIADGIARMNAHNNGTDKRTPLNIPIEEEIDEIIEEVTAVERGEVELEDLPEPPKLPKKKKK